MQYQPTKSAITRASRVRLPIALASLAAVALLCACGSSKSSSTSSAAKTNLDTARVAHSIEQSIFAQRHLTSKVVCPAAIPQEKGRTFECIATTRTIKTPVKVGTTPFVVTVQNDKGYVTYAGK